MQCNDFVIATKPLDHVLKNSVGVVRATQWGMCFGVVYWR
ncbi:hypothetical protein [Helicobacter bizzozeronii]|nr:hypothetical protein [Helicobacter bizzozeronii]